MKWILSGFSSNFALTVFDGCCSCEKLWNLVALRTVIPRERPKVDEPTVEGDNADDDDNYKLVNDLQRAVINELLERRAEVSAS